MKKIRLSRKSNYRKSLTRNLLTSFILHESVITTKAKSKVLKSEFEKLVHKTKEKDLNTIKFAKSILFDNNAVKKLFEDIHPRILNLNGSISNVKLQNRLGDNSQLVKNTLILKPITVKEIKSTESKEKISKKNE